MRLTIMQRLTIGVPAAAFAMLASYGFCAAAGVATAQTPMQATAPETMMPAGDAAIMRECDRLSMAPDIKMEDRAAFVKKCVADKKAK